MERHEIFSLHARQRSQQRGIPLSLVENILELYDCDAEAGDDCRVLRVSRNAARNFAAAGGDRQIIERLSGIAIVRSDRTSRIVTVIRDGRNRAARRYRVGN